MDHMGAVFIMITFQGLFHDNGTIHSYSTLPKSKHALNLSQDMSISGTQIVGKITQRNRDELGMSCNSV